MTKCYADIRQAQGFSTCLTSKSEKIHTLVEKSAERASNFRITTHGEESSDGLVRVSVSESDDLNSKFLFW